MSRYIPKRVREIVYAKQNGYCANCNEHLDNEFDVDHIVPWSISKDNSSTNLQALCLKCHRAKTRKELKKISTHKDTICWECNSNADSLIKGRCKECRRQDPIENAIDMLDQYKFVQ